MPKDLSGVSREDLEQMFHSSVENMAHVLKVLVAVLDETGLCEDEDSLKEFAEHADIPFNILKTSWDLWKAAGVESEIRSNRIDDLLENPHVPDHVKSLLRRMRANGSEPDVIITVTD